MHLHSTKNLYTIDRLVPGKPRFMNMENKMCGHVETGGYDDITFGLMDALHLPQTIEYALFELDKKNKRQPLTRGALSREK